MPDKKQPEPAPIEPTNYQGDRASQETSIRDAQPGEKPADTTIAQFEEIHPLGEGQA